MYVESDDAVVKPAYESQAVAQVANGMQAK
jgi:hypothetical protein